MKKLIFGSLVSLLFIACANNPQIIYDKNGYSKQGYNIEGYNKFGLNKKGFDKSGYNKLGFNENGYDKSGFNSNGYDGDGYNKLGFNGQGFNKYGYNKLGFDEDGYDKNGFNSNGYDNDGYNKLGFDGQGFNDFGYNKLGFNEDGYDKNGFNSKGYNIKGYNKQGLNSNGLTKKQVLKKKFDKLIKSKSTIKEVFHSILKKQEKDKYESDKEYKTRIQNTNFNTYAIMDIDIKTEYNPNKKQYKIFFDTNAPYLSFKQKFDYGAINQLETKFNKEKLGELALEYTHERKDYDSVGSNAFGHKVDVTNYTGTNYIIYPNNLESILNMNNIHTYTKKYYNNEKFYYIAIDVHKKQAKLLDKQKLKLKVGIEFNNIFNLYKGVLVSSATIDSPTSMMFTNYLFKGQIKEFVLFIEDTKEILFHYVN